MYRMMSRRIISQIAINAFIGLVSSHTNEQKNVDDL
jgi:hypothetical protein